MVVGVDGSEPGFEACRLAARLAVPESRLELFSAVDLAKTVRAGFSGPRLAEELVREATAAMEKALEIVGGGAASRLVRGEPAASLLHELRESGATLVVVGTHGHSRVSEMLLGGVAGELLHGAPCSVLIARPPAEGASFPRSLLVGVDGSTGAEAALAVAQEIAARFAAPLRVLVATGGGPVDPARARRAAPAAETVDEPPVEALVAASGDADLLVVGSRGLRGLRALGSVSERVAHEARCSVLVVRTRNG